MLLIPPTLGLVHQLKFILEQPFVICALDNRARLARNLLAALLFIAFRAVMAVSIPSIALGALLFRGGKPCTWESGASYYAYMTGQTLPLLFINFVIKINLHPLVLKDSLKSSNNTISTKNFFTH